MQKINTYIKTNMIIYKLICRNVCNSGTTLWNLGKEGKEKGMTECQQYKTISLKVEDIAIHVESC
jgi:hypothetical protein